MIHLFRQQNPLRFEKEQRGNFIGISKIQKPTTTTEKGFDSGNDYKH